MNNTIDENFFKQDPNQSTLNLEKIASMLREAGVPEFFAEELFRYTTGEPLLVHYFLGQYNKRADTMMALKKQVTELYDSAFVFESLDELKLLAASSHLEKIPYPLMASLSYTFKQSIFRLNQKAKEFKMYYEEKGNYQWYPFFKDYLTQSIEKTFCEQEKQEIRTILCQELLESRHFQVEYLFLGQTDKDNHRLEVKLEHEIAAQGLAPFEEALKTLEFKRLQSSGLKTLLILLGYQRCSLTALSYLMKELRGVGLYPILLRRYRYFLGRKVQPFIEGLENAGIEENYHRLVECWRIGTRTGEVLDEEFYREYGFPHVPDYLIHSLQEKALLKEGADTAKSYRGRLSVLYYYYLKGEYKRAEKLFFYLLTKYKKRLIEEDYRVYTLILAHHYYGKKNLEKGIFYLETALSKTKDSGDELFLLKIFTLYLRILMEKKDLLGISRLHLMAQESFSKEKPFLTFIDLLGFSKKMLEGQEVGRDLDNSIQYCINIGDEVTAVQLYSYTLEKEDLEGNNLLKVQEGLLNPSKMAIYHNTSIIDLYRMVPLELNFFGSFRFMAGYKDCSGEFQTRRKLRKILAYLVHSSPNKVSREELKRVFWDKDKAFDLDANLRVALSTMKKILAEYGLGDLMVCESGRVFINSRYQIVNDYKMLLVAYKRAKTFFQEAELVKAESYLKKIIQLSIDRVFPDISWDFLEIKVRKQVEHILESSLEMLLELARRGGKWAQAEDYCRRLYRNNEKYLKQLAAILGQNGKKEEALTLLQQKQKRQTSLETIFFPD